MQELVEELLRLSLIVCIDKISYICINPKKENHILVWKKEGTQPGYQVVFSPHKWDLNNFWDFSGFLPTQMKLE